MSSNYKRKGGKKFVMLERYLLNSAAWQDLIPVERSLLIELKYRYNGVNNGRIPLSCRDAADLLHVGKDTANRAFAGLMAHGFLAIGKPSGFNVKGRVSTEWRLTEYNCDVTGELATKEFTRWRPDEFSTVAPQGQSVAPQGQFTSVRGLKSA